MASTTAGAKRTLPCDLHSSDDEVQSRNRRVRTSLHDPDGTSITKQALSHEDYTIVWVCALSIERAAAEAVLDEEHESLPPRGSDNNIYTLGSIAEHNVVIASLPEGAYGVTRAAHVLTNTRRTFPNLRYGLMVGIGGGVPGPNNDIRLGDVIVGLKVTPYGPAKVTENGRMRTEESVRPDESWLQVLSKVRSRHERTALGSRMAAVQAICFQNMPAFHHPQKEDNLFPADYIHTTSDAWECRHCDVSVAANRDQRPSTEPKVHYGTIASSDDLIKRGVERERLGNELDVLCVEMETAGLMGNMRCLPIRGIADYADSHKNKAWQRYAAANAASFTKEVLELLPSQVKDVQTEKSEVVSQQPENTSSIQPAVLEARTQFLDFLKFERFDVRRKTMKSSYRSTCRWLLRQSEYRQWLDEPCSSQHSGFLWIKGNPGTGKSTLMKFAFEEESRCAKKRKRQGSSPEVVASFFFNARGNNMEQSVEGMYRALILQILQEFSDLQCLLDAIDFSTIVSGGITVVELEDLFKSISANLNGRRVTCFIDALDEGGRKQVTEMVKGFQDLFEDSTLPDSQLRICFSSRHYPFIEPRVGLQVTLEKLLGHDEDLKEYVLGNLDIANHVFKQDISTRLLEKAQGIFLWTALVVDYLNNDISEGLSVSQSLSARLEKVPKGLNELFRHLLDRHPSDMSTFRLMVAWMLFSREPLSPRQVDHALWSGSHGKTLRNSTPPTFDEPDIEDRIRRRVISASKGLAEILATEKPTVQFIHESVRDFLLKDGGLEGLWRDIGDSDVTHHCHELLKDCCDQYINHPLIVRELPPESRHAKRTERHDVRQKILDEHPLLQYACQTVLWHADAAAYSFPQEIFLSGIDLMVLVPMLNLMEDYKSRLYRPDHDLLSIIANRGHAQLIRGWTGTFSVNYTYPMVAAIAGRQKAAFLVLMEKILPDFHVTEYADLVVSSSRNLHCEGYTILMLASRSGCDTLVERLLQEGARVDARDEKGMDAYDRAACHDHLSTLRLLMRCSQGALWNKNVLLKRCMRSGSDKCATWLIKEGTNIKTLAWLNHDHLPMLHIAVAMGMLSTQRAIIEREADVNETNDPERQTPLHIAARYSQSNAAETLLENGADVNAVDNVGQTPLHLSVLDVESAATVAGTLLKNSADVNAVNRRGQTPLHLAVLNDGPELAATKTLLENGANVNAVDSGDQTPLHKAVQNGWLALVEILLKDKADVNAVDSDGQTPLHKAAQSGWLAIVEILLKNEADVNAVDSGGQTPLHKAVQSGRLAIVEILLQNEADANAVDSNGQTPLIAACSPFRPYPNDMIDELFRYGACESINRCNHLGQTALTLISKYGDIGLMHICRAKGADCQVLDLDGHSLFWYAHISLFNVDAMFRLLIEWGTEPSRTDGEEVWSTFTYLITAGEAHDKSR